MSADRMVGLYRLEYTPGADDVLLCVECAGRNDHGFGAQPLTRQPDLGRRSIWGQCQGAQHDRHDRPPRVRRAS